MKQLKDYLIKHKLSQYDFAKKHDFNPIYVNRWVNGKNNPNAENLIKLLNILNNERQ
jgi:transcriptional regulator with XRE-family HTH domain